MQLINRKYQTEDDYWRIRIFLREVFLLNDRRNFSWPVARLDYWRWHGILNLGAGTLEKGVYLWETPGWADRGSIELGRGWASLPSDPSGL